MTVQEIQQLRNNTSVAQLMKQVQASGGSVTGISPSGTPRTSEFPSVVSLYNPCVSL